MTPGTERPVASSARWMVGDVEVLDGPFDPAIDGPSNAQVFLAGIRTRATLLLVVGVELAWMAGQLATRWELGRCIDPPPFLILHRANVLLAIAVVIVALRARKDARTRRQARLLRDRRRQRRAQEVRAAIAESLARHLEKGSDLLH